MQKSINILQGSAETFFDIAKIVKLSKPVYDNGWKAKEIISHVVFYHEYYSSIVEALVQKKKLPLIDESLAKVNIKSAKYFSRLSRKEILLRFSKAQSKLTGNALKLDNETKIPYKKGGRIYQADDYILEISRHLLKHAKDLKRKKR